MLRKLVSVMMVFELIIAFTTPNIATAATLTNAQDILSTNKISEVADHTLTFVTPTGIAAGESISITFSGFAVDALLDFEDIDFAEGDSGTCSTAVFTDKTLAASAATTTWGAARMGAEVITITSATGTITAGRCVQIEIGSVATSGATGTSYITNPGTSGSKNITIAGTMADSTVIAAAIVDDPQVDVSALVGSTLTMSLSGTSASLGTLSASSTATTSTTVTISTNSSGGYRLKYLATDLTNQSDNVLTVLSSKTAAAPGTEQWGLNAATVGNLTSGSDSTGAPTSNYDTSGSYMVVPDVLTTLALASGTADTHAYTVTYGADISGVTPSGNYTGTVDYLVYGEF